jgi:hypothetical protein
MLKEDFFDVFPLDLCDFSGVLWQPIVLDMLE